MSKNNSEMRFEELDDDEEYYGEENSNPTIETEETISENEGDEVYEGNTQQQRNHTQRNQRQTTNHFNSMFGDDDFFQSGFLGSRTANNDPFGSFFNSGFGSGFGSSFGSGFGSGFEDEFREMKSSFGNGNGNSRVYSSSSTSTTVNGVTQSTHRVRDSGTGKEKLRITRKVGDQECEIEKEKDHYSGHQKTTRKLKNLSENELSQFENAFNQHQHLFLGEGNSGRSSHHPSIQAIENNLKKAKKRKRKKK